MNGNDFLLHTIFTLTVLLSRSKFFDIYFFLKNTHTLVSLSLVRSSSCVLLLHFERQLNEWYAMMVMIGFSFHRMKRRNRERKRDGEFEKDTQCNATRACTIESFDIFWDSVLCMLRFPRHTHSQSINVHELHNSFALTLSLSCVAGVTSNFVGGGLSNHIGRPIVARTIHSFRTCRF